MSGRRETTFLCHACGSRLEVITSNHVMLWCRRCRKRRRPPTHPALVSPQSVAHRGEAHGV